MQEFEVTLENTVTVCRTITVRADTAEKAADFALFLDAGDEHAWRLATRPTSIMLDPIDLDGRSHVRKVTPAAG